MVANDNLVVALGVLLAILVVFLGVAFFSLFDIGQLIATATNQSDDIVIESEIMTATPSPTPPVLPELDRVAYPVPSIDQTGDSPFSPSVGDSERLGIAEKSRLCTIGFEQPSSTAGCLYWHSEISYETDYFK